jgi:hypothetical protein
VLVLPELFWPPSRSAWRAGRIRNALHRPMQGYYLACVCFCWRFFLSSFWVLDRLSTTLRLGSGRLGLCACILHTNKAASSRRHNTITHTNSKGFVRHHHITCGFHPASTKMLPHLQQSALPGKSRRVQEMEPCESFPPIRPSIAPRSGKLRTPRRKRNHGTTTQYSATDALRTHIDR